MTRRRSAQTGLVLVALPDAPTHWRHGYDIARETGLRSGTLYPILIRLAELGLLEASWEEEQPAGRPRRHLYRLTADGVAAAREARAAAETAVRRTAPSVRPRLVRDPA
jgi:PadR family transcriptional regulator, regulatory protein PadR